MTEYRDWSITASANTGNAVDGYFKENMAYSDVNDAAREFQAILARDRLDKNGTLVSTGATSSYIVTINATLSAYQDGDIVAFQAHAKNDGASTLTIRHPGGSLSARPVVKTDLTALNDNDIVAGGTYVAFYKSASANWQLQGLTTIPSEINKDLSISGSLAVSGGITGDINGVINGSITAHKTADTSRSASTTFTTDPHLTGISLSASTYYKFESYIEFAVQNISSVGLKFNLSFSSAPTAAGGVCGGEGGSAVDGNFSRYTGGSDYSLFAPSAAGNFAGWARGFVHTNAATTVDFEWAQFTSHASDTTIFKGSWIKFEPLA